MLLFISGRVVKTQELVEWDMIKSSQTRCSLESEGPSTTLVRSNDDRFPAPLGLSLDIAKSEASLTPYAPKGLADRG
jgi:hypothetical protein